MNNDTKTIAVLTTDQARRKAELEVIISSEIGAFKRCGIALAEVRDEGLYLDEFDTFEEYMEEKWGMSRSRGYQLIAGAEAAKRCQPLVDIPNERAARPLTKLEPKQQIKAAKVLAKTAKAGQPITVATVAQAVAKVAPRGGLASTIKPRAIQPKPTGDGPLAIIDAWWAEEGPNLMEYPVATPKRTYELIRRLFE